MSGIAGLVRFDGRTVMRRELERAANTLKQYGPDRVDIVAKENIGLVHSLMRMTPEDRFDHQPHQGASGSIITADLRLDNRDELLARIGISGREVTEWPDSRLLLTGWEKFGDDIWPMLRGPFAAAIWDSRRRSLTLARDHLGLNVVMWHKAENFFAFASMPNGLFALDDVPRELCEEKLADFLVLNHADHVTTMYRNVFRVPPAHSIRVAPDGSINLRRYWSPADVKPVRLSSDAAYADGLRGCLDLAVRRQMRSIHPVGCLLSGGLDSSSVSVLAARAHAERNQRLIAFTGVPRPGFDGAVPDGCYADETPYVDAIQRQAGNIDVEYVRNDECDDFAQLERFFIALDGPVRNPTNFGWMTSALHCARQAGAAGSPQRSLWKLHHKLEWLVTGGWPSPAWPASVGVQAVATLLPEHALLALGRIPEAADRATHPRTAGQLGGSPPPPAPGHPLAGSRANSPRFCDCNGGRTPGARGRA